MHAAEQRGVQYLRPVGGRQQDDSSRRVEAIELYKQLVERLLLLVVAAERVGAAGVPKASSSSMKMIAGASFRA
jgi:hypothetical protein